jgi:hypothetical protein
MDGSHFDTLVKRLATIRLNREQTLHGLAVGTLAALTGLRLFPEAEGKGKGKGKKRRKKKPVCLCSASGCTSLKVGNPSSVINQNPRCNYAGNCGANPCAATATTTTQAPSPPPPGCNPEAQATTCAGRCGTWPNNCGQSVTCPACPNGQTCLLNGTCARPCTGMAGQCNGCTGLVCAITTEGATNCANGIGIQCTEAQACTSTAECPLGFQCMTCGQIMPSTRCFAVAVCP